MTSSQELIWILDSDPACSTLYKQTLGLQYKLRKIETLDHLSDSCAESHDGGPRLLIADPENTKGSLMELFQNSQVSGNSPALPDLMIVTRLDNLELMRLFLKTGARDYIFKPIRPNELVAKVEKALHQIANREILILRNDLDGKQVNDLTFREHQLLTIFLSRPNRTVKRDELYGAIWSKVTVNRKTLDVHLFNLRRKLRPLGYDIVCQGQVFTLSHKDQSRPASD